MDINNTFISTKEDADIFMRQLLNIGEAMYMSGGEISRIEDSLHRLGKAYGAVHISIHALTSSILITAEFGDNYSITQHRRITKRSRIDCTRMEKLNQLCRDCASHPMDVKEFKNRVLSILDEHQKGLSILIGQLLAAISFTLFFGGNFADTVIAALGAGIITLLQRWIKPYTHSEIFFNVECSFAVGVFINLANLIIPGLHVSQIIIGDIMVLIPGVAITNSIRFILSGDIISSFEKLMDSLLQAFGIAIGFMLSLMLIKGNIVDATLYNDAIGIATQLITATLGTCALCMVFNSRRKCMIVSTVGGLICWAAYLLFVNAGLNIFVATLLSAILVGIYGEAFAYGMKVPTTILFIPACIPLIPGKNLYYSALAVISSDRNSFFANIELLALYAVGIALGLAIVSELEKTINAIVKKHRRVR